MSLSNTITRLREKLDFYKSTDEDLSDLGELLDRIDMLEETVKIARVYHTSGDDFNSWVALRRAFMRLDGEE